MEDEQNKKGLIVQIQNMNEQQMNLFNYNYTIRSRNKSTVLLRLKSQQESAIQNRLKNIRDLNIQRQSESPIIIKPKTKVISSYQQKKINYKLPHYLHFDAQNNVLNVNHTFDLVEKKQINLKLDPIQVTENDIDDKYKDKQNIKQNLEIRQQQLKDIQQEQKIKQKFQIQDVQQEIKQKFQIKKTNLIENKNNLITKLNSINIQVQSQQIQLQSIQSIQQPKIQTPKSYIKPMNQEIIHQNRFIAQLFSKRHDEIKIMEEKVNQYLTYLEKVNDEWQKPKQNLYKVYIKKGNYFGIIASCFAKRWWWQISRDEINDADCIWTQFKNNKYIKKLNQIQYNHLSHAFQLTNKKALFYNFKRYCNQIDQDPFQYIPVTFHLNSGYNQALQEFIDPQYYQFQKYFLKKQKFLKQQQIDKKDFKEKNIYIIKPGEETNRGKGIQVESDFQKIQNILIQRQYHTNGEPQTHIIQEYIQKPLLYEKRKFDIRCFLLVTSIKENIRAYWYNEGYIRTSSHQFSLQNLHNRMIHLTNDAIQKQSNLYGKFEPGNKISFCDFNQYLMKNFNKNLYQDFIPQMIHSTKLALQSVIPKLAQPDFSFEIFGLDFMIDQNYKTYLIEVNTNPCLEHSCALLSRIIPHMVENTLRIAIDPIFPPPDVTQWKLNKYIPEKIEENNKYELIYISQNEQNIIQDWIQEDECQSDGTENSKDD